MKEKIFWIAKYLGVFTACRWLTRKRVRVLAYHGIWLGEEHFGNFLYMSPHKFRHRMQLLRDWGYPVVPLSEVVEMDSFDALPNGATVLTIDDGWYSTYLHMLPTLEEFQFPATVYVCTYYCEKQTPVYDVALQYMLESTADTKFDIGVFEREKTRVLNLDDGEERNYARSVLARHLEGLPNDQAKQSKMEEIGEALGVSYRKIRDQKLFHLMTPDQIVEADRRGIDIQLHTHRHRIFHDGRDVISRELEDNKISLAPLVSRPLEHFCYPSGEYDKSVWPRLEEASVISATTTSPGLVSSNSNKFAMPRILDGQGVSDLEFEAELSGFGELKRMFLAAPSKFLNGSE